MPAIIIWAHGCMTRFSRQIPTNESRVIHPSLRDWPIDVIASNLIKESLATAETAQDLRAACHRLEKMESTEIVDHMVFGDEETEPTNVLLEHRLTPSMISPELCIYQPAEVEQEYDEFPVIHDGTTLGNTSLSVQLNTRKLLGHVASADGFKSLLSNDSAVLLLLKPVAGHHTFLFLSDIIEKLLPNLTISVARPKVRHALDRDYAEVIMVRVKSESNPSFAHNEIQGYLRAVSRGWQPEIPMEEHEVVLPKRCALVPVICRKYCRTELF